MQCYVLSPLFGKRKTDHGLYSFYMFINIGALVGQIGMVYCEYYVGFYMSFLLVSGIFFPSQFLAVNFWNV